jgi:hypothetical protein
MSFYDDASLVFLPSGGAGKDTKAYSIKPTNGDGDFTFSRGSNLTATRVDSNGLIEKGRENLLLQSNQFNTTWTLSSTSVTSGQSGYDGSTDAWLLRETAANSEHYIRQSSGITSGIGTFSFYAKKKDYDWVQFSRSGDGGDYANFNISNGTLGNSTSAFIDKSIVAVGNGWYRCSVTYTFGAGAYVGIAIIRSDVSSRYEIYAGDITKGTYIQDAQLEIGLTSTEYIESGATTGKAGILEDSPRFDYSGGASCPSLLLEPSRTNLIGYSEYANGSGWVIVSSGTIVDNVDTSPEGVINAFSFETTTFGALRYNVTLATSTTYTFSFYAKNVDATIANYRVFDITNSSDLVSQTSYFSQISTSEWSRIEFSFTTNATSTFYGVYPTSGNQGGTIQFYGAQLEEGSYSSSYIPNHSGGSVTREADSCSGAGTSSTFNDSEGVLYAEFAALADDQTSKVISLSDGTFDERVLISTYSGGSNQIRVFIKSGGSFSATITTTLTDITDFNKIAFRYKSGETKLFINGSLIDTSTDTFSISGLNALQFASGTSTATPFYGNAKQVIVFNTALSDAECITLTS